MRTKLAVLLAVAAVCVTTAWAGWYPEEQITTSRTGKDLRMNNGRKVVIATNGVRHLVWSGGAVYYNRYYPQSGWTADYKLSGNAKNSWLPAIALDPNGTDIHVVWEGGGNIYYQKCVPGTSGTGGWVGTPRNISNKNRTTYYRAPSIACYKDAANVDHVVVAWYTWIGDPNVVWFCECVDGNWGQPIYFENPQGNFGWQPSVAADPQARQGEVFVSTSSDQGTVYVRRRMSGVWQPWENVGAGAISFMDVDPGTGCPHVVCMNSGIYHAYRDPDNGWQPAEKISGADALDSRWPSMAFSNGSAFVVWSETTSSAGGVRYTIGQYGNWTSPAWLTHRFIQGDINPVSTAASPTGDVYTVYMDEAGRYTQLFGTLYTPGSGGGQAGPMALSQSGLELFPNPANAGRVTVHYTLPRAEPARVTLLDVSGRTVRTEEVAAAGGSGSFNLDASGLTRGVYILKFESGASSLTRKLVIE
jgi:hypothetical protein